MAMLDTSTPEGRKALRLMTVKTTELVKALGLGPIEDREKHSKADLCLMAVTQGLTLRDFIFSKSA